MPYRYKRIKSENIPPVVVTCAEAKIIDFLLDKLCVISLFSLTAKSGMVLRNALWLG